jgi:hypothetical protein
MMMGSPFSFFTRIGSLRLLSVWRGEMPLMGATFEDEDQLFQSVTHVLHRISRAELEAVLTSGSLDWTHASSDPEIMLNQGKLLNTFLLFYLELIWPC